VKRFLGFLSVAALGFGQLDAQAIPALGADHAPGSAGVETFASGISFGLPRNPAAIGGDHAWAVGFVASGSSVTDVSERSVGVSLRSGSIGIGARGTARRVDNLFDDPSLENSSDLRVQDTEVSLGVSVVVNRRVRIGALGYYVSSEVLGTSGEGTGYRLGAQLALPWFSMGLTYGEIEAQMGWEAVNTPTFKSPGTHRLAVGVETARLEKVPLKPMMTAELDFDRGETKETWVRGNLSLSLYGSSLRSLCGIAVSTDQRSRSYSEVGVLVAFSRFDLGLGLRFGADPVPGDSYSFGGQAHSR